MKAGMIIPLWTLILAQMAMYIDDKKPKAQTPEPQAMGPTSLSTT